MSSTLSTKKYICPLCHNKIDVCTNHKLEIYTECKECSSLVLYPENDDRKFVPTFLLKTYYLNLEDANQREIYLNLTEKLSSLGNICWAIQVPFYASPIHKQSALIQEKNGEIVSVYSESSFESQYITNLGRLHEWAEFGFDNKMIRSGYYLERLG